MHDKRMNVFYKQIFKPKKETVCNRYESGKTSGADYKFIKLISYMSLCVSVPDKTRSHLQH